MINMSRQPINAAMQWVGLGDASQAMHLVNDLRLGVSLPITLLHVPCLINTITQGAYTELYTKMLLEGWDPTVDEQLVLLFCYSTNYN